MTKKAGTITSAVDTISQGLTNIRDRIAKLKQEADVVHEARVPMDEAVDRMMAGFRDMEKAYEQSELDFHSLVSPHYQGWGLRPFPYSDDPMGRIANGAMWVFFSEILTPILKTKLQAWYKTQPGPFIRSDERPLRLAKIADDILDLEFEEEDLISSAEAAGITVMRRGDADPRAVLNVRDPAALTAQLNAAAAAAREEKSSATEPADDN